MTNLTTFRAIEDQRFEDEFLSLSELSILLFKGSMTPEKLLSYIHAREDRLLADFRDKTRVKPEYAKNVRDFMNRSKWNEALDAVSETQEGYITK